MKSLILPLSIVTFALAILCLYGWPHYQRAHRSRQLQQAWAFLRAGDFARASLNARAVLQHDPTNVEACSLLARLAEISRSAAAVDWRQRIAELSPTTAHKLELARVALHLQRPPYALAAQTLAEMEIAASNVPAFHVLSAELDVRLNRPGSAAAHFEQAAQLQPANELHWLNLATLNLQSDDPQAADQARLALERLSTNAQLGVLALRSRIADDLRRTNVAEAELLSGQVLTNAGVRLEDRLQHLEILQLCHAPEVTRYLQRLQSDASADSARVYAISEWMRTHGFAASALSWLNSLEPTIRRKPPLPLAEANLYVERQDWSGLEVLLRDQKWGELEFMRLALLARAAWGQEQDLAARVRWQSAGRAAAGNLGQLTALLNLAYQWAHNPEDLLWQIGQAFPREQWALDELEQRYLTSGNTRGLNGIYGVRAQRSGPAEVTNQNNFASTSLLLKVNLPRAHELARSLYRQNPRDPIITSTYAYSLHLQGRTHEAQAVLGRCPPDMLRVPCVALYYAVVLAASASSNNAAPYLTLAKKGPLLPEEKQLLEETEARLAGTLPAGLNQRQKNGGRRIEPENCVFGN